MIVPVGYTDVHDAFYARGEGHSPPHQELPQVFDQLVRALATRHDALWSQALCDLFNLANESRQELAESIATRMTLRYERPRSVTVAAADGAWALTLIVMHGAHLSVLLERLLSSLVAAGQPSPGNVRLVIAWDPVAGVATADYFQPSGGRYMRVPPALFWTSSITTG